MLWAKRDAGLVPDHWRQFKARTSPLTRSPRLAANPANGLLNYAYAILEAEARIAILTVGLDPGMGVLHADLKARDSLALDLMEAARHEVDAWLLEVLGTRSFRKADFFESRDGNCRLMPSLAKVVTEMAPRWRRAVAPFAEAIAHQFVQQLQGEVPLPTPLTQKNRRARRSGGQAIARHSPKENASLPVTCRQCGSVLDEPDRTYCKSCRPDQQREQSAACASAGRQSLAELREAGVSPAYTSEAGRKRGQRNAPHNLDALRWERDASNTPSRIDFAQDVLPQLQSVPLRQRAQATGLSGAHCAFVRRGLRLPHRRHWEALAALANSEPDGVLQGAVSRPASSSSASDKSRDTGTSSA